MATGVLVIGVGRATRLLHHLVLADKAYAATIRLGQSTITDDAEGESARVAAGGRTDRRRRARRRCAALTGEIDAGAERGVGDQGRRRSGRTSGSGPARTSQLPPRAGDGHPVRRTRPSAGTDRRCWTWTSRSTCSLRHLRPGPRPRPRRGTAASAGTSPRCAAPGSARSSCARRATLDELAALDDPVTVPLAGARPREHAGPARSTPPKLRELSHGRAIPALGIAGLHGALAADGTSRPCSARTATRRRPVRSSSSPPPDRTHLPVSGALSAESCDIAHH